MVLLFTSFSFFDYFKTSFSSSAATTVLIHSFFVCMLLLARATSFGSVIDVAPW